MKDELLPGLRSGKIQAAFPLERFFRDAKLNQIGEGSSKVHTTVIGRDVLRRSGNAQRNPCLREGSLVDC